MRMCNTAQNCLGKTNGGLGQSFVDDLATFIEIVDYLRARKKHSHTIILNFVCGFEHFFVACV